MHLTRAGWGHSTDRTLPPICMHRPKMNAPVESPLRGILLKCLSVTVFTIMAGS